MVFSEVTEILVAETQNTYLLALSIVGDSENPLGAWHLRRCLAERGVQASEATCGRLLRSMEDAGHVASLGRRGRAITSNGERLLREWREKQVRDRTQLALLQSLRIKNPEELVDVLIARRAIEAETAAVAAQRATKEEIQGLREVILQQQAMVDAGSSAIDENTAFHLGIARASKNKVLVAALELIYNHPDVMRALEYIRAKVGSEMVEDHRHVLEEIAKKHVGGARRSMAKHMTNVIDDIGKYMREWGEQEGQPDDSERQDP